MREPDSPSMDKILGEDMQHLTLKLRVFYRRKAGNWGWEVDTIYGEQYDKQYYGPTETGYADTLVQAAEAADNHANTVIALGREESAGEAEAHKELDAFFLGRPNKGTVQA